MMFKMRLDHFWLVVYNCYFPIRYKYQYYMGLILIVIFEILVVPGIPTNFVYYNIVKQIILFAVHFDTCI